MESYTIQEAARLLGVGEDQVRHTLQDLAAKNPTLSGKEPLTKDTVEAVRQALRGAKPAPAAGKQGATVFCVTSGKGGVGKTAFAVNTAVEFARRGYRTIVVDADLGLANAHILGGVKPAKTLSDLLDKKAELHEIIVDGPGGAKFVSGGSGVAEMANLDDAGRKRIVDAVQALKPYCDIVVIDTGAGVSKAVTDFVAISDHTIVVTTSNFAAIADAYGIVKIMVQEGYRRSMHLVVNRVRSPEEAEQVFKKLKGCTERFLSFDLNWLGLLPEDTSVEGAVTKRSPFCESFPNSVATRYLKKVVTSLERFLPVLAGRTG